MDSNSNNSRWRKPTDKSQEEVRKEELRRKFQENEEKRKQLALENQRRRRDKEEQLKLEQERKKKSEEQVLDQRRKDKEEAYVKYLRNNAQAPALKSNLYDKYEIKRRQEIAQVPEIKPASKWKTAEKSKQQNNLVGLDLDIQATKDLECIKKFYQKGNDQLKIIEGFEEEWEDSQQLLKSALLDSLDLDINAMAKSKHMSKNQPGLFEKDFADLKKSIVFIQEEIVRPADPDDELKDIIGYESGSNFWNIDAIKPKPKQTKPLTEIKPTPQLQPQPPKNQAFKKVKAQQSQPQIVIQAKKQPPKKEDGQVTTKQLLKQKPNLMGWTGNIDEEADELFSNCSNPSRKSFPRSQILKQINQKLTKEKKGLQPVPEQSIEEKKDTPKQTRSSSRDKNTNRSISKEKDKDKAPKQVIRRTPQKINVDKDPKRNGSLTDMRKQADVQPLPKQKYVQQRPLLPKPSSANKSQKDIIKADPDSISITKPKKQSKTVQKFRSKLTQHYAQKPTTTVCTQDDMFHIDEFIKDQLRDINEKQRALQMEIKKLHVQSKEKVKDVETRHQVNTAITSTKEITKVDNKGNQKKNITESQMLQESLYRIDQMLIRKQQNLKHLQEQLTKQAVQQQSSKRQQYKQQQQQKQHQPTLTDETISVSELQTPEFFSKDTSHLINPLSSSNELQQQIARLTQQLNEQRSNDTASMQSGRVSVGKDGPPIPVQNVNSKENGQKSTKAGPSYAQLRKMKAEEEKPGKWKQRTASEQKQKEKQKETAGKQCEPVNAGEAEIVTFEQAGEQQKIQVNDRLRRLLLE